MLLYNTHCNICFVFQQEIVSEQCKFLTRCLKVFLHSKLHQIDQDFVIDIRTFKNFQFLKEINVNNQDQTGVEQEAFGIINSQNL